MVSFQRITGTFLLSLFAFWGFSQQVIPFENSWGKDGFTLLKQGETSMVLNFSVTQLTLGDLTVDGVPMKTVEIPGVFLPNNEGAPNIPGTGRYLAIPEGASVSLEILESRRQTISNILIAPAPRIPKETEDGLEYHSDLTIYGKNECYPSQIVQLSEPTQIRGVDAVMLGITPFQYNPVTRELLVFTDIKVRIHVNGGNGHYGEDRLRSRWFDPLLQDMLFNPDVLPVVDYNKTKVNTDDVGCEYLIIVPNDPYFSQWADTIREFRTRQGIITEVKTLAEVGGNTESAIENYLNNAYNTWDLPPVACLLIGDYGTNAANTLTSPIWDAYCVSDNIYGDVDGNSMPDIVMARMTAQNEAQLEVMVHKFINYEKNPPTDPDFYNHPISALGWQTERWFQICSEVIRGFWEESMGKSPVRINEVYIGNPQVDPWSTATNTNTVVNYFGPNGLGYIPATPQGMTGWTGGNASQVNAAINSGSFMLQHRDHGMETGWGEPAYGNNDINGLNNTDLCFIMSVNCLTGKYNYPTEVFAEKFHRYTFNGEPAGALGLLAASEVSYSFVNDAFIWGVYDNLWPEFMPQYGSTPAERGILPAFGNAAGKYFLQQSSWPYNTSNKEVTYNLFHHHGDAFLTVFSEVPQTLTVVHDPIIYTSATTFAVTANPGSLICLSLNGEILGTATGTGAPVSITIPGTQLPPDIIDVTVTLQNFYRYEGQVTVIPPVGPYVIRDSYTINDAAGNGNGQADFAETISLNFTMKNVGVMQADNVIVTLQTADPNITFTDNTENYGSIPSNTGLTVNDAFAFTVSDQVPDGHPVTFDVIATNGTDTWTSHIYLSLRAPHLAVTTIVIDDASGNNNHRLDPGETVTITLTTQNNGHSDAPNTNGTLISMDPSVTVVQGTQPLNTIIAGNNVSVSYTLQVSSAAVPGSQVMLNYNAVSGNYQVTRYILQYLGTTVEDWESNSFTHFNWNNTASSPWTITSQGVYEGQYCARSGVIGNNASSTLSISLEVLSNDSISFFRRVSSEANYDFLIFNIDGNAVGQWSGEWVWGKESYPVTPGVHTFTWVYQKDQGVISGGDAGWIDYVSLPSFGAIPLSISASASPTTICLGSTSQLDVVPIGGIPAYTYTWSPASSLSDPNISNPLAIPVSNTVYKVTVTDLNGTALTDQVTITVNNIPATPNTPASSLTSICQGTPSSMVSTVSVPAATGYQWTVTPSSAGSTNGTGVNAWVNWNSSFSGQASVTVKSGNSCGYSPSTDSLYFTVKPAPSVSLGTFPNTCVNYPPFNLSGGMPAGGTYAGAGVSNGIFTPSIAGTGNASITYTVSGSNGCNASTSQIIYVDPCTGMEQMTNASGFLVFPNPSQGILHIARPLTGTSQPLKVTLSNPVGQEILLNEYTTHYQDDEVILDLSRLSPGMYLLHIDNSDRISVYKILLSSK